MCSNVARSRGDACRTPADVDAGIAAGTVRVEPPAHDWVAYMVPLTALLAFCAVAPPAVLACHMAHVYWTSFVCAWCAPADSAALALKRVAALGILPCAAWSVLRRQPDQPADVEAAHAQDAALLPPDVHAAAVHVMLRHMDARARASQGHMCDAAVVGLAHSYVAARACGHDGALLITALRAEWASAGGDARFVDALLPVIQPALAAYDWSPVAAAAAAAPS